ncbi:MAG TPA: hypothetical protein VHU19_14915 [Pyrinomonadaceae bacterium]|jgi:hypothetical protein|nr:hypothetical protein [Pyrinomonadaceae bacterium]
MSGLKKFEEVLAMYRRHGWRLARVLARSETLEELRRATGGGGVSSVESNVEVREESGAAATFEGFAFVESEVDALWFARAAQGGREAWELRLVGEPPYALFELFEPDEEEEDREEVRREMESRLCEYAAPRDEARRE